MTDPRCVLKTCGLILWQTWSYYRVLNTELIWSYFLLFNKSFSSVKTVQIEYYIVNKWMSYIISFSGKIHKPYRHAAKMQKSTCWVWSFLWKKKMYIRTHAQCSHNSAVCPLCFTKFTARKVNSCTQVVLNSLKCFLITKLNTSLKF